MQRGSETRPAVTAADAPAQRHARVRAATEAIAAPLAPEDQVIQTMPDVSPTRWHLAHVTWFFETFLLLPHLPGWEAVNPQYQVLFNSYYNAVGDQWSRPRRGWLSRPTVGEVMDYRARVDEGMQRLLATDVLSDPTVALTFEVGLNHEQQHQELMLTDIKHVFSVNPLFPVYADAPQAPTPASAPPDTGGWTRFPGGIQEVGHPGGSFAYDNEGPLHEVLVRPYALADRLVTNGEYLAFVEEGGYERHELWLSDGWARVQAEGWRHPLYWHAREGGWFEFTLRGLVPLDPARPVSHLSFYEASAYAAWREARLPTEAEWELAARATPIRGNLADAGRLHTWPANGPGLTQLWGDVWEWTASPYVAYPGFRPLGGALGEYNGKFMSSQMVLRGGSWATPQDHLRPTYRNFFPPDARWQVTGLRLARDD